MRRALAMIAKHPIVIPAVASLAATVIALILVAGAGPAP